jgi:hypothetical protein
MRRPYPCGMSSIAESHLGRAALDALWRASLVSPDAGGWVARAAFREELGSDAWVMRNGHRLSRLDSTLATLASEGLVELRGDPQQLRLLKP